MNPKTSNGGGLFEEMLLNDMKTENNFDYNGVEIKEEEPDCFEEFESQESQIDSKTTLDHYSRPYQCDVCVYRASSIKELQVHLKMHQRKPKDLSQVDKRQNRQKMKTSCKCGECNLCSSSKTSVQFKKHKIAEKSYRCEECDLHYTSKKSLEFHLKKHTNTFKSDEGGSLVSNNGRPDKHVQHTGVKAYKCEECDLCFALKKSLTLHMKKHSNLYSCSECSYSCASKDRLDIHRRRQHMEKPYECEYCDFRCDSKSTLIRHSRQHTGEKPYECEDCNFCCASKGSLIRHLRQHTGEKPYGCKICSFSSTNSTTLKIHLRKHSGERPYNCDDCGFSSSQKTALIIHIRAHTGEKPYKCEVCGFGANTKGNLALHIKKHRNCEKTSECSKGEFSSAYKTSLNVHMNKH